MSDEDYEAFKDLLLEALHKEWPKAAISLEEGEHAAVEVLQVPVQNDPLMSIYGHHGAFCRPVTRASLSHRFEEG